MCDGAAARAGSFNGGRDPALGLPPGASPSMRVPMLGLEAASGRLTQSSFFSAPQGANCIDGQVGGSEGVEGGSQGGRPSVLFGLREVGSSS